MCMVTVVCRLDWSILSPQSKTRTVCILRNVSRFHCVKRTMKYQLSSPRNIRNRLQNSRKSKVKDSATIYAAFKCRERHLNSLKICVMKQRTVVRKPLAIGKMSCFLSPKNRGRGRGIKVCPHPSCFLGLKELRLKVTLDCK